MNKEEPDSDEKIVQIGENSAPPAAPPSGYGRPPIDHQFKKGVSGNPRGRPRKITRSFTPRQMRRDVLSILESQTKVRTEKGVQTVTVAEAIILRCVSKALSGHGPSIRYSLELYGEMIHEHYESHDKFRMLENAEKIVALNPGQGKIDWVRAHLESMRKSTRRT